MANINAITATNRYLDFAGLSRFWELVKQYIINTSTHLEVSHEAVSTDGKDVNWAPADNAWITISDSTDASGTTYTIDDGNIEAKFTLVESELATIKANAGVTGVKVNDVKTGADSLVSLTLSSKAGAAEDVELGNDVLGKGDITIKLDETALINKVASVDSTIAAETDDRKEDIKKLAGEGYTAADGETAGAWTDSVKYKNITAISQRLASIDASVVTKVTVEDVNNTGVDYVKFTAESTTEGVGDIKLKVDETALDTKITAIDADVDAEETARKEDIKKLAGEGWDGATHAWKTEGAPAYKTITQLSAQVKTAEAQIGALTGATEFVGVVTWDPTKVAIGAANPVAGITSYPITGEGVTGEVSMQNGDIVIFGNKEYILDVNATGGSKFVELGDTTAEIGAINDIVEWINAPIEISAIEGLFAAE